MEKTLLSVAWCSMGIVDMGLSGVVWAGRFCGNLEDWRSWWWILDLYTCCTRSSSPIDSAMSLYTSLSKNTFALLKFVLRTYTGLRVLCVIACVIDGMDSLLGQRV